MKPIFSDAEFVPLLIRQIYQADRILGEFSHFKCYRLLKTGVWYVNLYPTQPL